MNSSFSRKVMPSVDLVLIAKCPGVDATNAVPFRALWRSVEQLEVEDLPLRADECSAYLGYLYHYYYVLPRWGSWGAIYVFLLSMHSADLIPQVNHTAKTCVNLNLFEQLYCIIVQSKHDAFMPPNQAYDLCPC